MAAIEERISDRHLLKLLRAMLRAGVMMDWAAIWHRVDLGRDRPARDVRTIRAQGARLGAWFEIRQLVWMRDSGLTIAAVSAHSR
jgi:hypothetical protein